MTPDNRKLLFNFLGWCLSIGVFSSVIFTVIVIGRAFYEAVLLGD